MALQTTIDVRSRCGVEGLRTQIVDIGTAYGATIPEAPKDCQDFFEDLQDKFLGPRASVWANPAS